MNYEPDSERIEHATKAALSIALAFAVVALLTWILFVPAIHYMVGVWLCLALIFAGLAALLARLGRGQTW